MDLVCPGDGLFGIDYVPAQQYTYYQAERSLHSVAQESPPYPSWTNAHRLLHRSRQYMPSSEPDLGRYRLV